MSVESRDNESRVGVHLDRERGADTGGSNDRQKLNRVDANRLRPEGGDPISREPEGGVLGLGPSFDGLRGDKGKSYMVAPQRAVSEDFYCSECPFQRGGGSK
jgi:hypothetical protein